MRATVETLWSRALRAANERGLLPSNRSRLTPGELGAEAERRGEGRLAQLVDGWYYPASYGRIRGILSDEEAARIVVALETAAGSESSPQQETGAESERAEVEASGLARTIDCQLCGFPLPLDQ